MIFFTVIGIIFWIVIIITAVCEKYKMKLLLITLLIFSIIYYFIAYPVPYNCKKSCNEIWSTDVCKARCQ